MQKLAQTWGYFAPAHEANASRENHESAIALKNKAKDALKNAIGPLTHQYTLEDTAHQNSGFNDPYYHNILVGGANAGGKGIFGLSYLPFGVAAKGNNQQLLRWNDAKKIKEAIDKAVSEGKNVRVFGHSWGGSTVSNIAKDYPGIPFYALDPVSRLNRLKSIPSNLTILRPRENTDADEYWTNKLAPLIGGRWPKVESQPDRYVEYNGGHVLGVDDAVNRIISSEMSKRIMPNTWDYFAKNIGGFNVSSR